MSVATSSTYVNNSMSNTIIDLYLVQLKNVMGDDLPYNNNVDKSETETHVIWLIKWNSNNITFIIYDKAVGKYYVNLNPESPRWLNICKNVMNILTKPGCKIDIESRLFKQNYLIETSCPFDICSIGFGSIDT